ncbi:hypothetical protein [Azospirillum cavernae]|uniref:hypothetical protein n=1 Tax=Azospirillum cavernae TaxID=2320860 RepID=UPI0011C42286|nr:hypothetical protein [Azospirillum cavernae]
MGKNLADSLREIKIRCDERRKILQDQNAQQTRLHRLPENVLRDQITNARKEANRILKDGRYSSGNKAKARSDYESVRVPNTNELARREIESGNAALLHLFNVPGHIGE